MGSRVACECGGGTCTARSVQGVYVCIWRGASSSALARSIASSLSLSLFLSLHPFHSLSLSPSLFRTQKVALDALRLHFLDASVPPSQVLVALNGTLVGLCVSSPEREGGVEECVGLGLVRAVNAEKRLLYIITPLGVQQLQRVDVLVRGRGLEVPVIVLLSQPSCSQRNRPAL